MFERGIAASRENHCHHLVQSKITFFGKMFRPTGVAMTIGTHHPSQVLWVLIQFGQVVNFGTDVNLGDRFMKCAWSCWIFKVCRLRRRTFLFLLCFLLFLLKVCRQRRKTFLFLFCFFFLLFFLSYFSLQQIFSNDFSIISQPISMKFGRSIVLDETKSLNIISSQ